MEMEVTDVCMDKEADHVIVYSDGVSNESNHKTFPNHQDDARSYDHVEVEPEIQIMEDSTDAKDYEVKECTTENTVEISESSHTENNKDGQSVLSSNVKADLPKEKVKEEDLTTKDNTKSGAAVKHPLKATAADVRTKRTVPRPFALATEKRASNGTRPAAAEPGAPTPVNKSSNANGMLHSNSRKQNQVI